MQSSYYFASRFFFKYLFDIAALFKLLESKFVCTIDQVSKVYMFETNDCEFSCMCKYSVQ